MKKLILVLLVMSDIFADVAYKYVCEPYSLYNGKLKLDYVFTQKEKSEIGFLKLLYLPSKRTITIKKRVYTYIGNLNQMRTYRSYNMLLGLQDLSTISILSITDINNPTIVLNYKCIKKEIPYN